MTTRPRLPHEELGAELLAVLRRAQSADLAAMRRSDVTLLRADLDLSKRLQMASGQVAPWSEWRGAAERVNAELARRDAAA